MIVPLSDVRDRAPVLGPDEIDLVLHGAPPTLHRDAVRSRFERAQQTAAYIAAMIERGQANLARMGGA